MPSGQTHDRLTWIGCPIIAVAVGCLSRLWQLGAIAGISYLVGGLFLSPDLDTYSLPYQRWGYLRWLWWPYRQWIPHRSVLSHGPIIGTVLRLIYGGCWLGVLFLFLVALQRMSAHLGVAQENILPRGEFLWSDVLAWIDLSLRSHPYHWLTAFMGLEVAAMVHYLSDWGVSRFKGTMSRMKRSRRRH
ncbi:metal-binding protein [Candidatus Synechococcus calcipolaris G9]|uniref:Metal-binding protein n=1 Tax=Candidatus Synechococcus calcipolaris G9 TaxID=1497997 RepID=A0ABT6F076_9SYNE|nr:metal-binding protein [Candidatus Synechococcus calcipolaris]MDG2991232.1 metal-binding protein [Candidatus Synechococcus calcipolaris G9]